MKNLKLSFIALATLVLGMVFLVACSENDSIVYSSEKISEKVIIGASNPSAKRIVLEAEFTAEIDPDTELVISYDVSENLLEYLRIDKRELDLFLQDEMGDEYYTIFTGENGNSQSPHSDCMGACDDRFLDENGNKIEGKKGYGKCRWRCWVDTAVRILEAIF